MGRVKVSKKFQKILEEKNIDIRRLTLDAKLGLVKEYKHSMRTSPQSDIDAWNKEVEAKKQEKLHAKQTSNIG